MDLPAWHRRAAVIASLNEIAFLVRKAARGAGYAWGLAEEAGRAARWLSQRGLPGPELMAALLTQTDGRPYRDLCPFVDEEIWRAEGGALCPVVAGTALTDLRPLEDKGTLTLDAVLCPLLLAPFAAQLSSQLGDAIAVRWEDAAISLSGDEISLQGSAAAVTAPSAKTVNLARGGAVLSAYPREAGGRSVELAAWRQLEAFAHRTYAPESAASRVSGAGAGLLDND